MRFDDQERPSEVKQTLSSPSASPVGKNRKPDEITPKYESRKYREKGLIVSVEQQRVPSEVRQTHPSPSMSLPEADGTSVDASRSALFSLQ